MRSLAGFSFCSFLCCSGFDTYRDRIWPRRIFLVGAGLLCAFVSLVTDFWNYHLNLDQQLSHRKWVAVDTLLKSDLIQKKISRHSLIYAPSLWDNYRGIIGIDRRRGMDHYWRDYFRLARKKGNFEVTFRGEDLLKSMRENPDRHHYYLKYDDYLKGPHQYLVFARIRKTDSTIVQELAPRVLTDRAYVFHFSSNRTFQVEGLSQYDGDLKLRVDGNPPHQQSGNRFASRLATDHSEFGKPGRFQIKSKQLLDPQSISIHYYRDDVVIDDVFSPPFYDETFYDEEVNGTTRWRWTNSKTATVTVVNHTEEPRKATLHFELGSTVPRKVNMKLGTTSKSYTLDSNGLFLAPAPIHLTLQPGIQTVEFSTDVPPDERGRSLAFRLVNLRFVPFVHHE